MRRFISAAMVAVLAALLAAAPASGAASYPTTIKAFTTKNTGDVIQAAHINDLQDEVAAVETALLNGFQHALKPLTASGQDVGTASLPWRDLFIGRTISVAQGTIINPTLAIDVAATWNDAADTFTLIKGNATDTASNPASLLLDLQADGISRFKVVKDGSVVASFKMTAQQFEAFGTMTADIPALFATPTWNAGGVTFTGIKFNVTDTASAAASKLLDIQIGGTSRLLVRKDGDVGVNLADPTVGTNYELNFAVAEVTGASRPGLKLIGRRTADGSVGTLDFTNNPSGATYHRIGVIFGNRSGADNSGQFIIQTMAAGVEGQRMILDSTAATFLQNVVPNADGTLDLGSSSLRWNAVHTEALVVNAGTSTSTVNAVGALDRDVTEQDVVNTVTETTCYSFSVLGGTLGTNRGLRFTLIGDYLNNSGGAAVVTVRVKYGATQIFSGQSASISSGATRRGAFIEGTLHAKNATNAQVAVSFAWIGNDGVNGSASSAIGTSGMNMDRGGWHTGIAEDSTLAKTFAITIQHDVANANISFICRTAFLEVVQ